MRPFGARIFAFWRESMRGKGSLQDREPRQIHERIGFFAWFAYFAVDSICDTAFLKPLSISMEFLKRWDGRLCANASKAGRKHCRSSIDVPISRTDLNGG